MNDYDDELEMELRRADFDDPIAAELHETRARLATAESSLTLAEAELAKYRAHPLWNVRAVYDPLSAWRATTMSSTAPTYWTCQCGVQVPMGCSHTCAHIGPTPGRELIVNPPWPTELLALKDAEIASLKVQLENARAAVRAGDSLLRATTTQATPRDEP